MERPKLSAAVENAARRKLFFPPRATYPKNEPAMILGLGIDVIEISRIRDAMERHGNRFRKRIFTDVEQGYCEKMPQPLLHYAARFAAKEAFSKAVGLGMTQGIRWVDIGVENEPSGAPRLRLEGRAADHAGRLGAWATHVSLSHSHGVAAAVVVLEGEKPEDSPLPPG
jgi:holo-[acyl-carrier protein] synthase